MSIKCSLFVFRPFGFHDFLTDTTSKLYYHAMKPGRSTNNILQDMSLAVVSANKYDDNKILTFLEPLVKTKIIITKVMRSLEILRYPA